MTINDIYTYRQSVPMHSVNGYSKIPAKDSHTHTTKGYSHIPPRDAPEYTQTYHQGILTHTAKGYYRVYSNIPNILNGNPLILPKDTNTYRQMIQKHVTKIYLHIPPSTHVRCKHFLLSCRL